MEKQLKQEIMKFQKSYDIEKAELENSKNVEKFIALLDKHREAWDLIYNWKEQKIIIIPSRQINLRSLSNVLLKKAKDSYFFRKFLLKLSTQYKYLDDKKISSVNNFLLELLNLDLVNSKNECFEFCPHCNKFSAKILEDKERFTSSCDKCKLQNNQFLVGTFHKDIIKIIENGQITELFTKRILKSIKGVELIKMNTEKGDISTSIIYTLPQFGDGEIDCIAIKNNTIILVECKLIEISDKDIKRPNEIFDRLFNNLQIIGKDIKYVKIFVGYGKNNKINLEAYQNTYFVDIRDISIEKTLSEIIHRSEQM